MIRGTFIHRITRTLYHFVREVDNGGRVIGATHQVLPVGQEIGAEDKVVKCPAQYAQITLSRTGDVAYVVTDEDDSGVVWETWPITDYCVYVDPDDPHPSQCEGPDDCSEDSAVTINGIPLCDECLVEYNSHRRLK